MGFKKILLLLSAATILLCTGGTIYAASMKPVDTTVSSSTLNADSIFILVNRERIHAGLNPLVRDSQLDTTSGIRVEDMVKRNYYSHFDPITGKNLVNVGSLYPNMCSLASENINKGAQSNVLNVKGWMNSKPHHDAILNPAYTLSGIAVSGDMVVQHFCVAK